MGQKVNPIAFRVGVTEHWRSRWYATKKNFGDWLVEDQRIRRFIKSEYGFAGIARIEIERIGDRVKVQVWAVRPGLIIGKKGAKVDKLSEDVAALVNRVVDMDVKEIETPELDAQVVGEAVRERLEKREPYRRTMRRAAEMVMQLSAKGVKILCKGRLGGAEIARSEKIVMGTVPLSTLRADVDYATSTAILTKGTIGIKVWIYKGEKFKEARKEPAPAAAPTA
ncbi:MAG: 30S ribosomal protein S3 [Planctomycetes bacterium]|nr:30S ribosomal protein S3 [Planctomycetota bacterium]